MSARIGVILSENELSRARPVNAALFPRTLTTTGATINAYAFPPDASRSFADLALARTLTVEDAQYPVGAREGAVYVPYIARKPNEFQPSALAVLRDPEELRKILDIARSAAGSGSPPTAAGDVDRPRAELTVLDDTLSMHDLQTMLSFPSGHPKAFENVVWAEIEPQPEGPRELGELAEALKNKRLAGARSATFVFTGRNAEANLNLASAWAGARHPPRSISIVQPRGSDLTLTLERLGSGPAGPAVEKVYVKILMDAGGFQVERVERIRGMYPNVRTLGIDAFGPFDANPTKKGGDILSKHRFLEVRTDEVIKCFPSASELVLASIRDWSGLPAAVANMMKLRELTIRNHLEDFHWVPRPPGFFASVRQGAAGRTLRKLFSDSFYSKDEIEDIAFMVENYVLESIQLQVLKVTPRGAASLVKMLESPKLKEFSIDAGHVKVSDRAEAERILAVLRARNRQGRPLGIRSIETTDVRA